MNRHTPVTPLLAAAGLWTLAGCASTSNFVKHEELEAIGQRPVPPKVFQYTVAKLDRWELEGPLATRSGHAPPGSATPLDALLAAGAPGRLSPSQALGCVARERARFSVSAEGEPPQLLSAFIESRCGVPTSNTHVRLLTGKVDATFADGELLEQWKPQVAQMISEAPPGASVGIALARANGRAAVALAHNLEEAELEPIDLVPAGDTVTIKGRLRVQAESVFGAINHGDGKAADCVRSAEVPLPDFVLECPVPRADERAWLEVGYRPPNRYLGTLLVQQLVFPRGQASAAWQMPALAQALPQLTPDTFVAGLNQVRERLGLKAVQLAQPQSLTANAVAPHYFVAETTGDRGLADQIARGLTAGWQVQTAISEGHIGTRLVPTDAQPTFLAELLESPGMRSSLLSEQTAAVALGLWEDQVMTGALVMSYRGLHANAELAGIEPRIIEKLNAAREKAGLDRAVRVLLPGGATDQVAEAVRSGRLTPSDGLEQLMQLTAETTRRTVSGWHLATGDLDEIDWPPEMITRPGLQVMFVLTTSRGRDEPWTRYHLLFALMSGAKTQMALAGR